MAKNKTITIPEGNDFTLLVPMYLKNADGTQEPIVVSALTDIIVRVDTDSDELDSSMYEVSRDTGNCFHLSFQENLEVGNYSIHITAKLGTRDIATHLQNCFGIVEWNENATYLNYIHGEDILAPDTLFVYGVEDDEIATLRQRYEEAITEANSQRDRYIAAAEQIENVEALAKEASLTLLGEKIAKEQSLDEAKTEIISAIPTDYAKENTLRESVVAVLTEISTMSSVVAKKDVLDEVLAKVSSLIASSLGQSDKKDVLDAIAGVLSAVNATAKESTVQSVKSVVEANTSAIYHIKDMVDDIREWEEEHVATDEEIQQYYDV